MFIISLFNVDFGEKLQFIVLIKIKQREKLSQKQIFFC